MLRDVHVPLTVLMLMFLSYNFSVYSVFSMSHVPRKTGRHFQRYLTLNKLLSTFKVQFNYKKISRFRKAISDVVNCLQNL